MWYPNRSQWFAVWLISGCLWSLPAMADPVTLRVTGTVPAVGGVPTDFTNSPLAIGDAFSALVTYDSMLKR